MKNKWDDDTEFYEETITDVEDRDDGYTIKQGGMCFGGVPKPCPIVPKAGMVARFYAKGHFHQIRGLLIDGVCVFYKTPAEQEAEHVAWLAAEKRRKEDAFVQNKSAMDAKYDALPPVLRRRIDKFRANNPDFRVEYESYEMFCCEQAVAFADALKTTEAIQAFHKAPYDEQRKLVPAMNDGHSGNTFGCACSLAMQLVSEPENVVRMHGALAPLVGSEEYGCVPRT